MTASPVRRVLMTGDAIGGVFTYALDLSEALAAQGTEVMLVTMGRPLSAAQRSEAQKVPSLSIVESSHKLEWMDEPWPDVERAGDLLLALERRHAPDIVHLNGYAHGALPFRAPVLVVGHSCVLSWWRAVKREPPPERWDEYRARVRAGIRAAHAVVAPTRTMLRELGDLYGPLPRARVIHNGCDRARFCPRAKEPIVLAAGRLWDEAKNLAGLARASEGLGWPVCVAGDDKSPAGVRERREAHAGGSVRTLGALSRRELAAWLGRASIYAAPARYEPFGLSILEAAASGAALVLGDIASLRELWDGAAEFVPPEDHAALRCAVERLIDDDSRRRELASRARERSLLYTVDGMGDAYRRTYVEMASHRAGRAKSPSGLGQHAG